MPDVVTKKIPGFQQQGCWSIGRTAQTGRCRVFWNCHSLNGMSKCHNLRGRNQTVTRFGYCPNFDLRCSPVVSSARQMIARGS